MRALVVATLATALLLAGCVGAPEPTAGERTPLPSGDPLLTPTASPSPTPSGTSTPTAVEYMPGTRLPMGPEPGTVLGPTGAVLRFVPADSSLTFRCRSATAAEREQVRLVGNAKSGTPTAAVDLPAGLAVVAYRDEYGGRAAMVTNGTRFTTIGEGGWPGSHTHAGVAVEDGPKAHQAVFECIGG